MKPVLFSDDKVKQMEQQATNIIVESLNDQSLCVVRTVIDNPSDVKNLHDRYVFNSTASKISLISKLVSIKSTNTNKNLNVHIYSHASWL